MESLLSGKRIVVTGCGYTKLEATFRNLANKQPSHDEIVVNGERYKMNMGAAAANVFAKQGAQIVMVSRSEEKLKNLQNHICFAGGPGLAATYAVVDLMDESSVASWAHSLSQGVDERFPLYWFHSVGASAGSFSIGNRWLPFQELTLEHFSTEVIPFWATTVNVARHLWPIFTAQRETRIVLISSMSAIRGYRRGASHCAAEAAMDRLANVLMLEGYPSNIFVTTLRAGGIDTGTYENKDVQESVITISNDYAGRWRDEGITLLTFAS